MECAVEADLTGQTPLWECPCRECWVLEQDLNRALRQPDRYLRQVARGAVMIEQDLIIEATPLDLIEHGWDEESLRRPEQYLRPLLSCGHYDCPTFESSSQWDFPQDEHICPTCGETRQWDVRVQATVIESWSQP